jgi:hypothetical protein
MFIKFQVRLKSYSSIFLFEAVQRRATKLVKDISHLNYVDRLRQLGLPALKYRRDINDMIQVYKAIHGIDDIFLKKPKVLNQNALQFVNI